MNMRIGSTDEATTGWGTHAAWVHLRKDSQQLATDTFAGAEKRVILADKAAVVERPQSGGAGPRLPPGRRHGVTAPRVTRTCWFRWIRPSGPRAPSSNRAAVERTMS